MRAKTLLDMGAKIIAPLKYSAGREKSYGYMWGGRMVLKYGKLIYNFELWHHGGYEMTEEEALKEISLKGIQSPSKYYDVYWYCMMSESEIWLNPRGWFYDRKLEEQLLTITGYRKRNYNFDREKEFTPEQVQKLKNLGFIRIVYTEKKNQ